MILRLRCNFFNFLIFSYDFKTVKRPKTVLASKFTKKVKNHTVFLKKLVLLEMLDF